MNCLKYLQSDDIRAYIRVDGDEGRAKVYGASSKDTVTEGYIEGKTGSKFVIHVSDHRNGEEQDDVRAEAYIDGQYAACRHLWKDVNRRWELSYVRPTMESTADLTFSDLVLTNDEEVAKATPAAVREHIGTIEIRIFKVKIIGEWAAGCISPNLFPITTKVVMEDEVKDKRSHCTSFSDLHHNPRTPLSEAKKMGKVQDRETPLRTFKFTYISKALLGQRGFIIEDKSHVKVEPTPISSIPAIDLTVSTKTHLGNSQSKIEPTHDKSFSAISPHVLKEVKKSSEALQGFSDRLTEDESDSENSDQDPDGDIAEEGNSDTATERAGGGAEGHSDFIAR